MQLPEAQRPTIRVMCLATCLVLIGCSSQQPTAVSPTSVSEFSNSPVPTAPSSVTDLIAVLSSANDEARIGAANALAAMGSSAEPAVPALTRNLYYRNSDVRKAAASALGSIGPSAQASLPLLVVLLLDDPAIQTRREAASALGKIGNVSAVPALAAALDDADQGVAIACAKSISTLAVQDFPDVDSTGYTLDEDGNPRIVVAAKEWWQQAGQSQTWLDISATPTP